MSEGRKEIKHREMMEIFSIPAVFADRMYVTPKGQAVTICFSEDVNNADDSLVRARVAMHVPAFLHFAQMMNNIALQITTAMQEQQGKKAEASAEETKVIN